MYPYTFYIGHYEVRDLRLIKQLYYTFLYSWDRLDDGC